ncbi:ATP-grasp peptide maturase system methyltransferase [Streptosporangium sp. NBC_01755]|uniref:ATP-grasp peptide maturase system methyltransferase n=1 Tax=unclassified Streptosporangium TaxID=2632669 RepID=UPI002DD7F113|nr:MULTISPECIES: ATP-grasp peptide maturase system methyltransferase [unclassified Streptosporangium]WSA26290.1 ATP-grasp peptide maturase system methyltransferase [Streptosporangium sp. NBC_01810]WSD02282.1 ATP-grasp peptide maturase system methyltransferase [Streptosporangium sp. NBC_01755]
MINSTADDLATKLAATGALTHPRWREAVKAVPREAFLGDAVYRPVDGERETMWQPVHRTDSGEGEWSRLAYADETWVTQVNGVLAEDAPGPMTGDPTSSATLPSLVVRMLEAAQIAEGDKVLEIGTGTGYSTALLSYRLGDHAVTSIEYDRSAAARAAVAITAVGYTPALVVGDGLGGYEKNAEYDRLIATCSVRYIPAPWMWQVRDGGTITTPLSGWMTGSALAHLTLSDDGTASGRFHEQNVSFMPARQHSRPPRPSYLRTGLGDAGESRIDPGVLDDWTGLFVAQLGAPSAEKLGGGDDVFLLDVATGSQATTERSASGGWTVRQHGPLRLWDAVENAILTWQQAGSPHQSAFGLTVTRSRQYIWLERPEGPSWNLPI